MHREPSSVRWDDLDGWAGRQVVGRGPEGKGSMCPHSTYSLFTLWYSKN